MIIDTEEELLHTIKQWFKKHGKSLIIATSIFLSIGIGWYAAQRQNTNKLQAASVLYEELAASLNKQDSNYSQTLANRLVNDYTHTPYAKLGALFLAKDAIDDGKFDAAKKHLSWVMEKSEIPAVRQIARNRLARVLLAENQKKSALEVISTLDDPAFSPLVEDIKGDIQKASGQKEAAHASYLKASKSWPKGFPGKELIKLKLQALSS